MILNILISTIDKGIEKIADILLASRNDVQYIISHQYRDKKYLPIPKELIRNDVIISQIQGQGLTKSRNNAIRLATGDICAIADDDVSYTNEYFDTILNIYKENEVDVACFKICKEVGKKDYKYYPEQPILIHSIKERSVSSIEITFNRASIKKQDVFFDERFGLGSWLNGGGENLFLHDCINSRQIVKFFPYYIVQHRHDCTIVSKSKYDTLRVSVGGALDARINGVIAIPKAFLGTIKFIPDLIKHKKNPLIYLKERLFAAIYILKTNL